MSSLKYLFQNHGVKSSNPSERICVNKIENGLHFKITAGYYLKVLTPETLKLL